MQNPPLIIVLGPHAQLNVESSAVSDNICSTNGLLAFKARPPPKYTILNISKSPKARNEELTWKLMIH